MDKPKITLDDISKVAVEGTPITHDLVLPTPVIAIYDTDLKEWSNERYGWLSKGALHFYNVIVDKNCDKPQLRLKPDYDYSSALPFDVL